MACAQGVPDPRINIAVPPDACPKRSSWLKYSPSLSLIRRTLWFASHLLKGKWKVKFIILASLRSI